MAVKKTKKESDEMTGELFHEPLGDGHRVGACRYCGQMKIFPNNGEDGTTQEDLDEAATMTCDCDDAKIHQRARHVQDYAHKRIENLFQNPSEEEEHMASLLNDLVGAIFGRGYKKITIQHTNGIKATISVTGSEDREKIKIKREEKIAREEEIC